VCECEREGVFANVSECVCVRERERGRECANVREIERKKSRCHTKQLKHVFFCFISDKSRLKRNYFIVTTQELKAMFRMKV